VTITQVLIISDIIHKSDHNTSPCYIRHHS